MGRKRADCVGEMEANEIRKQLRTVRASLRYKREGMEPSTVVTLERMRDRLAAEMERRKDVLAQAV